MTDAPSKWLRSSDSASPSPTSGAASKDQSALFRQDQGVALASRGLAIAVEPRDRVDLALQLGDLQLDAGRGLDGWK